MNWQEAQEWEKSWHGNCVNALGEQNKQILYAEKMGLRKFHNGKSPYNFAVPGLSIVDIGSGPTSLLLLCHGFTEAVALDPIDFPRWVKDRYKAAGIEFRQQKAEDFDETGFDEAWLYNVLQHTQDPQKIIQNAQRAANLIRVFEWINTPVNIGHIHTLTEQNLNNWLNGYGKVENIGQQECFGKAYYGIFPT